MAISADMVKKLREQTGVGMMDCKKALTETDGDYEAAITLLREKGIAVAAKRQTRAASEGVIGCYISDDAQVGVLVELNCETTFVAKTDEFQNLAAQIAAHVGSTSPDVLPADDIAALMSQPFYETGGESINDMINTLVAKLGEKTTVSRFTRVDVGGKDHENNGAIGSYIHMGSQIGVIVEMKCESEGVAQSEGIASLAKDISMHVAWSNPEFLDRSLVPSDSIEKERDINRQWAISEGKPEKVIERIVDGRMNEYYSRVCLMEQTSVKDPDQTIGDLLKTFVRDAGEPVSITRFVRFRIGESSGAPE